MKTLLAMLVLSSGLVAQDVPSSTLVVYRAYAKVKARWLHPSVYCDGKELTRIYRGTVFKGSITPGKRLITLGRTEVGQLIDMEPGKTYYFRFGHKNLFVTSLVNRQPLTLTPVNEATALEEMDRLKETR